VEEDMVMRPALAGLALISGSVFVAPGAHAQAPAMDQSIFILPMAFSDCMLKAATALRQAGGSDVKQNIGAVDMGDVTGKLGDYAANILCLTLKGVIILEVAGRDNPTAKNYIKQLEEKMGLR
jgi:hypothetical protein